ncbi:hypothetical protein H7H78_05450 [Mycobacterium shinjukuense]|uniref:Uncharacterized protein n=1 Tax=Mycobacterium shinjukuense TaxID=398694 RepID=A0A7I7MMT1_9MYCO|nr:hypothetical protein [Mycobacterium shinjukuense]MCV6984906.1 hypothetical protein [Mycobacterium shinjukuense]ORB70384.1 hypothetical protein BST45_06345 [Mycobacterium shinjukuense]BBX73190.1 hypothetical protein MSHI_10960 [Mycobacterium shinjukuense]
MTDGKTTVAAEGSLTGEALELKVVGASWRRPQVRPCPSGGLPALLGETTASGIDGFDQSVSRIPTGPDGVYRLDLTETRGRAGYPYTVTCHLEVRF